MNFLRAAILALLSVRIIWLYTLIGIAFRSFSVHSTKEEIRRFISFLDIWSNESWYTTSTKQSVTVSDDVAVNQIAVPALGVAIPFVPVTGEPPVTPLTDREVIFFLHIIASFLQTNNITESREQLLKEQNICRTKLFRIMSLLFGIIQLILFGTVAIMFLTNCNGGVPI